MGAEGHAECAVKDDDERLGDAAFSSGVSCSPARSALAEPGSPALRVDSYSRFFVRDFQSKHVLLTFAPTACT